MNLEFYKDQFDSKYEKNIFYSFKDVFPELFFNNFLQYVISANDNQFTFSLNNFFICKDFNDEIKVYYSDEVSVYFPIIKVENLACVKKLVLGLFIVRMQILNIPIRAIYGK